jgi:hypothetical protein
LIANTLHGLVTKVPLGTTKSGQDWCLKALHPSEPIVTLDGIPDQDACTTVFQAYGMSQSVSKPAGAAGSWNFDAFFFPHPYILGAIYAYDTGAAHSAWTTIYNTQIGNTPITQATCFAAFDSICRQYRIGYMGVTGYHDCSATANEGTIAIAQFSCQPVTVSLPTSTGSQADISVSILGEAYIDPPRTYEQMQSMPNAYLSNAREGFYAPYKLSRGFNDWHDAADSRQYFSWYWGSNNATFGHSSTSGTFGTYTASGFANWYPYGAPPSAYNSSVSGTTVSSLVHQRADTNMIQASARNLDLTSTYTFYIR